MQNKETLRDLHLKQSYDPSYDGSDVLNDFYLPCLSVSKKYDRCSAYFSSAVLKSFSKGLINFYKNNGHARFIFSCQIAPEEMEIICDGYKSKMDSMADALDESLDNDYEIANLGYLIAHNLAEVKIAFMMKNKSALMHIKSGMFEDMEGNHIYFDGSGNETEAGIMLNAETFNVFDDFHGENFYVTHGINRFNKMWDNTYSPETIRTEFPVGRLFEKLISYNKDRMFNSASEFYEFKDCVLIDINKLGNSILLSDYTSNSILTMNMILKSQFSDMWTDYGNGSYSVQKLNLHILKDVIIKRLETFHINYVLSPETIIYIETNDLELDKRQKLGLSIKQRKNKGDWENAFEKFSYIVNHEMVARLKDKQMDNAFYHYCMKSSSDFSVPGTGKTYISYGLFAYLMSNFEKEQTVNHLVVFGPLNCFRAWKDEAVNIFGDKHRFTIFDVTQHHDDFEKQLRHEAYDIYLINYDFISEKRLQIIDETILNSKVLVVFDEIHRLKSITGMRANLFLKMFNDCPDKPIYKLALTGTPLPNSFQDIYNYLKILYENDMEGVLSYLSLNRLKQADSNPVLAKNVSDLMQPLFVRTTKNDLNVPPADQDDTTSLAVEPTEDEKKLYESIWKKNTNPLVKFIRLIQASSNPKLLLKNIDAGEISKIYENDFSDSEFTDEGAHEESEVELIDRIGVASKTEKTLEKIKELVAGHNKVIVWCLFIDTIDLVVSELKIKGIKADSVSGRNSVEERDIKISDFKMGDLQVLVTNPNTLAESVSLHKACHNAIYLEYGFNLTYLLQSKDRIHRVGLTSDQHTHYYFAISKKYNQHGPIDEDIYARLSAKDKRMKGVIESNDLEFVPSGDDISEMLSIIEKL